MTPCYEKFSRRGQKGRAEVGEEEEETHNERHAILLYYIGRFGMRILIGMAADFALHLLPELDGGAWLGRPSLIRPSITRYLCARSPLKAVSSLDHGWCKRSLKEIAL